MCAPPRGRARARRHPARHATASSALTMRRLGAELGVQPSAIYHHFANKQALLAAVADEILARGARPRTAVGLARPAARGLLRAAATRCWPAPTAPTSSRPCGPSASARPAPVAELEKILADADVARRAGRRRVAHPASTTSSATPSRSRPPARPSASVPSSASLDSLPDFDLGLDLVIDGLRGPRRWTSPSSRHEVSTSAPVQLRQQHGAGEVEPGPPQHGRRQVDAVEARAAQVGAVELGLAQRRPGRAAPGPAWSRVRSRHRQVGLAQVDAGEVERATGWCRGS